jgi:hypothetical protein
MTAVSLLETALLLGLYVALAGAYGLVYAIVRLKGAAALRGLPVMIYALHAGAALAIVLAGLLFRRCRMIAEDAVGAARAVSWTM